MKLVAIDMDGTLLQSDKTISKETITEVKKAYEQGIEIVICTGRCIKELSEIYEHLPFIRYVIVTNGAFVYDLKEQKVLYENSIPVSLVKKIFEVSHLTDCMLHILDYECVLELDKVQQVDKYGMLAYKPLYKQIGTLIPNIEDYYSNHEKPIQKINMYHTSKKDRDISIKALSNFDLALTYAENSALEITAKNVNKGIGLTKLCQILNINKNDIYAIGDSYNDISMFEIAHCSFAMNNGKDRVKQCANYIVSDNDHNGVIEALEIIKQ